TIPAPGYSGPMTSANGIFDELIAGTYEFEVVSDLNCVASGNFEIFQPPALSATAVASEFACDATNGADTALITITVDGALTGTPPYLYSLDGVNFLNNGGAFEIANTGVDQAFNNIEVRDANGCSFSVLPLVIEALPRMTLDIIDPPILATCPVPTETITVQVTGESTNPASNLRFEVLGEGITQDNDPIIVLPDVGTYTIQVTDLNTGCFETIEYTVDPYDTIEVTASDPTPVT